MRLSDFKALTFDCYGTLIDWETGLWNALQPLLSAGRLDIGRDEALEIFGRLETEQELETPSLRYSTLLAVVHARMAKASGFAAHADLHDRFGGSVPDWPAFPDSAEASLISSAISSSSFCRMSIAQASPPAPRSLAPPSMPSTPPRTSAPTSPIRAISISCSNISRRISASASRKILHTAQSLHHDHVPAERAGLARAWIDRRYGKQGSGATVRPPNPPKVDFHFKKSRRTG